jgi:flagellar hook-associated protein 1 FlgK
MSLSHTLSNAVGGLTAASRLAEVVSSNVSNAMTDGYGRRQLDLNAASIGGRGAGVQIGGVTRVVDKGLIGDRRLADAAAAGAQAGVDMQAELEKIVGAPGQADALASRVTALEQSLVDAATDPASPLRLDAVLTRAQDLAGALNTASDNVQTLRTRADADIALQVDQLNTALERVEGLNGDITDSFNAGADPSGLMDQRQKIVDQISGIVPIRELARPDGRIALMTPDGEMLVDGPAKRFAFTPTPVITADMTHAGGGLVGISVDGRAIAPDGLGKLAGGSLGAAFTARDDTLVAAQDKLDSAAAHLIERMQDASVDPTLGPTDAGLFTDAGNPLDPTNTTGLAGRIEVNAAVDTARGGDTWRLRDGLRASAPGAAGDSSLLLATGSALSSDQPLGTGGPARSLAGHFADIQSNIGQARLQADEDLGFANARQAALTEAEAATGVDTDHEMQTLLRVEQAYAANARLVQTVETMLDRLMEL